MSEETPVGPEERERLLEVVRTAWSRRDPVPGDLVARMQAAAALASTDWDAGLELMLLVERSEELAGTRGGGAAYTLRFAHARTDLLLRVTPGTRGPRIDGWVVPPVPVRVFAVRADVADPSRTDSTELVVGQAGRFEMAETAGGLLRLRLEPADGSTPFTTPALEI